MTRRYAAFLRGVSPLNARMPDLKAAFEAAGFTEVRTLLASGNVVFTARPASELTLERRAEAAMQKRLGRSFLTFVRSVDDLRALLAGDPYPAVRLKPGVKRTVTFLRTEAKKLKLPIEVDGAQILVQRGREIFCAHAPNNAKGPVFMALIEKTFGREVTTRTWETVTKAAK